MRRLLTLIALLAGITPAFAGDFTLPGSRGKTNAQDCIRRAGVITCATQGTVLQIAPTGVTVNGAAVVGAGSLADDRVPVGDSTTAATWRAVPSCSNATTSKLLYDTATNSFSCGTDQTGGGGGTPGGLDTYVQFNDGGAFGGDADFVWDKTNNKLTLTNATQGGVSFQITNTNGGNGGGYVVLHDSASPAANDDIGYMQFQGRDSGNNLTGYAGIDAILLDPTDTSEDASFDYAVQTAGVFKVSSRLLGTMLGVPSDSAFGWNDDTTLNTGTNFDTRFCRAGAGNVQVGTTACNSSGTLSVATIELGAASDTTISRPSAGNLAIEGVNIIRGSTGGTDNALLRADGTSTTLAQAGATGATLSDTGALTLAMGTLTGSSDPALNISQTWNNGATVFKTAVFNTTYTAAAAQSSGLEVQRGGSSRFQVQLPGNDDTTVRIDGALAGSGPRIQVAISGDSTARVNFGIDAGTGFPGLGFGDGSTARDIFMNRVASLDMEVQPASGGSAPNFGVDNAGLIYIRESDGNGSNFKGFRAPASITSDTTCTFLDAAAFIPSTCVDLSGYQPLSANLTSWAAITRASGFDTFVATPSMANLGSLLSDDAAGWTTFGTTPSSANLRSLLTDEIGTGAAVFDGASPTFGTVTTTGNIELGNASDTTLSRPAGGRLQVEGVDVVLAAGYGLTKATQTMAVQPFMVVPVHAAIGGL